MAKLKLPNVTLVIYDMVAHQLAACAVRHSIAQVDFGAVHIWTDNPFAFAEIEGAEVFIIPFRPKDEGQNTLWSTIGKEIKTSHVLNIEWDSAITDPSCWSEIFLNYDFIGAPWPWWPPDSNVGNGGFSLISAKLLQFLAENQEEFFYKFPWDDTLCRVHRKKLEALGFRWASEAIASRFALEHGPTRPVFGFHDCRNFPRFLSQGDLAARQLLANWYVRNHRSWQEMCMGTNIGTWKDSR